VVRVKLRVAIVGCGKVAHLHAAALAKIPEAELVAVTDVDPARAQSFAVQYNARAVPDISAAQADIAIICTPHPQHAAAAIAAVNAGLHVLVEKPLAATVADCDAMIAAARRNRVRLGVVSQRRWFEPVQQMKTAIDAGKIGAPILGAVTMYSWRDEAYYRSDPWRGRWDTEGGGVLINQSPHHIDLLLWLMDSPVEEVIGRWANFTHPYVEVEDTAVALLRFRSGALATISVSLCQNPGIHTKIHIHGSNGASVGAQTDTGATFIAGMTSAPDPPFNDLWTIPGEPVPPPPASPADYHELQLRDFLLNPAPSVTAEQGRAVVEVIERIYARTARQVIGS
jgi:UDP-N-acetyl-2-amino-2-deoxyglucuronate dehydrogenase